MPIKNIWHVAFVYVNGRKAYAPRISRTICVQRPPYVQDGCLRWGISRSLRKAVISTRIVIRRTSRFIRNYTSNTCPTFSKNLFNFTLKCETFVRPNKTYHRINLILKPSLQGRTSSITDFPKSKLASTLFPTLIKSSHHKFLFDQNHKIIQKIKLFIDLDSFFSSFRS